VAQVPERAGRPASHVEVGEAEARVGLCPVRDASRRPPRPGWPGLKPKC